MLVSWSKSQFSPPYVPALLCHDEEMDPVFTPADIEEFRTIWREEFGEDLPQENVVVVADRFLRTIHLIVKLADRADAKVLAKTTLDDLENK